MKKKIVAIMMTALMVVSLIPMFAIPTLAATTWVDKPAGVTGEGTQTNPYCIDTTEELEALATKVNGGTSFISTYFKLTADIGGFTTPIGNGSYKFQGNFDGANHTVTLNMENYADQYAGLFGYTDIAEIKNVNTAGIVKGRKVGGISGESDGGKIINCHNSATIVVDSGETVPYAGGICGIATGTIENCYNDGAIQVNTTATDTKVGGISGRNGYKIINSYNRGTITITEGKAWHPIFGDTVNNNGKAINCYYDNTNYKQIIENKGTGLTTEKMQANAGTDGALIDLLNGYEDKSGTYPENFARWKKDAGANYPVFAEHQKYDVTISSEIKNGKVKADKEKAAKGETVELTATPNENYKLASIKVTDADGEEVTVKDNKFEMPASNVTVTAKFETVEYKMTKGKKQEIDLTDVKDAVFTSEADYSKFKSVKVDDKVVDSKNYTVKSGSTVVTLKADYLKTLKLGKHEIKILSDDGMATAEFTIVKTTPKTADANNMLLWVVIALAAICLTTCTVLRVKRTNK